MVSALVPAMVERTARRCRVRHLRRGRAPRPSMAAYVTSKWGLEGYVHVAADGTRGDRRTGHHRPAGSHPDRHGDGLGSRCHRRGHRAVGRVGIRPALQLHAACRSGPGRRGRGQRSPGAPTPAVIELQPEAPISDTETENEGGAHEHDRGSTGAAAGLGWRGRERPSRGTAGRPDRADAPGSAPSAAMSGCSASPGATWCC